jgi:pilus assembly protein CpaF
VEFTKRPDQHNAANRFEQDALQELRIRRASPTPDARDAYDELKDHVLQLLAADVGLNLDQLNKTASRTLLQKRLDALLATENIILKRHEKHQLTDDVVAELLGFGPLEPLLSLDGVDQIMVNGPKDIFVKRHGRLQRIEVTFDDDAHVMRIIERIVAPLGHQLDQDSPILDTRLPDGSHVNIVIPPVASKGPTITIKRAATTFYTAQELCDSNILTCEAVDFLHTAVNARLNVIITGLAGTAKTTLLRALCGFIPPAERIVTIEDMAELRLDQDHVIPMETRLAHGAGKDNVSAETLIMTTSRIRPDRLILGCIQGSEAFAWLQVINSGLNGSMTTCNAESPQDSLSRIEVMALLGGSMLPQDLIRSQITSAVDLIVHLERLPDNSLKAVSISEVVGFENDHFVTVEIFQSEQANLEDGQFVGPLQPTGAHSHCAQKIRDAGIQIPASVRI